MNTEITERTGFEAEVAPGLEDIATAELKALSGIKIYGKKKQQPGAVRFSYQGDITSLFDLKTVIAVYAYEFFDVPRPKALLGHQYFQRLLAQLKQVIDFHPPDTFKTLYFGAAGADSSIMQRLLSELGEQINLTPVEEGDLFIRIRRAKHGWETLVRILPRPHATRSWRVADMPGALNASVAHAIINMMQPHSHDTFLNIACGSGTLLIERATIDSATITGCDINPDALIAAQQNTQAAGYENDIHLIQSDAKKMPFPDNSFDKLCADLPFGQLVGSHTENQTLYPAVLQETARVAMPDATFGLITHEITLMRNVLTQQSQWTLISERQITLSGLHPHIYLLTRQ